ncbi:MAG: AAA family ATPase [Rhodobacteraceae bacterium]|nr:AAA family ATPase [Paracoccaceae bacterium]
MKIDRFRASGLHGYLNFDIKFKNRLTFLTGINGTGKTTALNSIVSLLMPDLQFLCSVQYNFLEVSIEVDKKKFQISSKSTDFGATLSCSGVEDSVDLPSYIRDQDTPHYRQEEYEAEYYREQISTLHNSEVIQQILEFPSPMYLGLDRRIIHGARRRSERPLRSRVRKGDSKRTIFSGNMENRLSEAVVLAERSYSQQVLKQNSLDSDLQRQLLLELINISPMDISDGLRITVRQEAPRVDDWLDTLAALPGILKLPKDDVNSAIRPMSEFLMGLKKDMADPSKSELDFNINNKDNGVDNTTLQFAFNRPHFEKIERVSSIIKEYDGKKNDIEVLNNRYLKGINRFFSDGGKVVVFDANGHINFSSSRTAKELGFKSLSSGEIQLFVILTHLYFNSDAREANLFIIDEPELSLHVTWQEAFVDGLLDATEDVQLILATHAPSIILHRVENCIEIEQKS